MVWLANHIPRQIFTEQALTDPCPTPKPQVQSHKPDGFSLGRTVCSSRNVCRSYQIAPSCAHTNGSQISRHGCCYSWLLSTESQTAKFHRSEETVKDYMYKESTKPSCTAKHLGLIQPKFVCNLVSSYSLAWSSSQPLRVPLFIWNTSINVWPFALKAQSRYMNIVA